MTTKTYYNENNPYCVQWLRNLIEARLIAPGDVDERSIEDVQPGELKGYTQCHFFAGIGGWSYALRLAGWPDDRPVWTGSCPCQPFSQAGKGKGFADERHLWPLWHWLIQQCRPPVIFGEQVTAAVTKGWLDLVCDDLEGIGYSCGAADLPAASAGAPHRRQRIFWTAYSSSYRQQRDLRKASPQEIQSRSLKALDTWHGFGNPFEQWEKLLAQSQFSRMANGISSTVDIRPRLHAYGNAIVPQVAAKFISACMECYT